MPVCPRCRTAFLDGEMHLCTPPRPRTALWTIAGFYVITYGVVSCEQGGLVNPGAVLIYLLLLVGSLLTGVVHLLLTIFHLTTRRYPY